MVQRLAILTALIACLSLGIWALPPYQLPDIEAHVVRVIDGDTIEVLLVRAPTRLIGDLQPSSIAKVRCIGIDTPETGHPNKLVQEFGREAFALNKALAEGKSVYLELDVQHWDQYGRLLAYVYLDPQGYAMVNAILVAMGFATTATYPPNVRYENVFVALERTARELGLGLWAPKETAPEPGSWAPCDCTGPDLDCSDFATQAEAQACYEYCISLGYGDVFGLDRDKDGKACESLR